MLTTLDFFNIMCGLITIASLLFALWVHFENRAKRGVETERAAALNSRLESMFATLRAAHKQCILLASVADRDETSKKELKHLAIAVAASIEALAETVSEEVRAREQWKFGLPTHYIRTHRETRDATAQISPE